MTPAILKEINSDFFAILSVSRKKVTKLNADRTPHESFKHNNIDLIFRFGKLAAI